MGRVALVGCGCGTVDLLTRKACALIRKADCILYDHLIDPYVLGFAQDRCHLVFVGKESGNHAFSQEQINAMLVELSEKYSLVVRLKGGDPYVFGRGSEEAKVLYEHGIGFEVVPGVSSCIAGLSYAGIPVTERETARGFRVYTAHSKDGKLPDLDFEELARTSDTVVFLMGRKNLPRIVEGYQKAKAPDLPIALVSNAARPEQASCIGKLSTILALAEKGNYPAPTLIVVGRTVEAAPVLNWYERLPLFDKKILYMHGSDRSDLLQPLSDLGATVDAPAAFEKIVYDIGKVDLLEYDWLVLTSPTAVDLFMEHMKKRHLDVRLLPRIAVVQEQSAKKLAAYGLFADLVGDRDAGRLVALLNEKIDLFSRVLIPHAAANVEAFKELKCPADIRILYEMKECKWDPAYEYYDAGLFTSARAARDALRHSVQARLAISIGPKTTAVLKKGKFKQIIEVSKPDLQEMIECLKGSINHV
ncbi:uroporphyrinogen-III C-methyltransferase [uncultured Dubosiella sp.]|uniref:uroporphyrinogen-III C-methyltransferase n=1 Tax=uncultured Dubosiella sp. TaxID=1937011 RepID=UPI00263BE0B1|nr:uroporphyrinogen-III C-methyltransferase [uncultured Dubosiella sp.]